MLSIYVMLLKLRFEFGILKTSQFAMFVFRYIVSSQGDVQLGGPVLAGAIEVPLSLRLLSLFYSLKVPLKLKEIRTLV